MIKIKFDISLAIFPKYKLVLVKIFKQLIITICLVSILLSSPAVALASQNASNYPQKGGSTTNNINNEGNTNVGSIGTINITNQGDNDTDVTAGVMAGGFLGGFASVSLVSIAGSITGLSAAGISTGLATIGGVVGGGMAAGLVVSAALPVAGVAGGLLAVQGINHLLTHYHHKQENNKSNA